MKHWFHSAGASCELVSINRFVDAYTFATHSHAYGATFQLRGMDPECRSDAELANLSARLIQAMRLLPEECSLQQIAVKQRGCAAPESAYVRSSNPVVAETQRRRQEHLAGRSLGRVSLYWTLCLHPPKLRRPARPKEQQDLSEELLRRLGLTLTVFEENLTDALQLERLDCHAIARLYGLLANLEPHLVRERLTALTGVDRQIARADVEWREDGLRIGKRYARPFSLLQRPGSSRPNIFGELLRLDADLIVVLEAQRQSPLATRQCVASHQRFRDLFRHSFLSILAHAKSGREIAKSANTVAADKAVDDLGGIVHDIENLGWSYTQASLIGLLHAPSKTELDGQMAQVHRVFGRSDAAVLEEHLGSLSAYCSLFPAAAYHGQSTNVRRFWLREDHLANLSLAYAPYPGEPRSEALEDEAVAIFETRSGVPFFYDSYSHGVRGLVVTGASGRGKSFWLNFLVDQEAKYGGFIFLFDIGGSFESTVLKHRGRIVRFGLDGPRLNPFALPPTEENLRFVFALVRLLLAKSGAVLSPAQELDLYERVKAMYALTPNVRRLKHLVLAPQLQPYLAKWIDGGVYGCIFDNIEDELRFSRMTVFEFQDLAGEQQSDLMEPLLFWLRWRTQAITHDPANLGVPKVEIYDECWKHLQDPAMLGMILNTSKTARKHLGGIVLATQEAADLGDAARLIRNSCSDTLFLGGPFHREAYREMFSLHDRQLDLIAGLEGGEGLLVRSQYSKVLRLSVDAESAWHYTTRPKDRARREEAIEKYGREEAFRKLAANGAAK